MAADTRTLQEHTFKDEDKLTSDDAAWLEEKLKTQALRFTNTFYKPQDGEQKIVIPTKKLFYRGVPVRAIGISGKTTYRQEIRNLPAGFDLMSPTSPVIHHDRHDGMFLIITEKQVIIHNAGNLERSSFQFCTFHGLDKFDAVGTGSVAELCGRRPLVSAVEWVNITCLHASEQGGEIDVWDSHTGKFWREPGKSFEERVDLTSKLFNLMLRDHRAVKEITEIYEKNKGRIDHLGGRTKPLYPGMYVREPGNPDLDAKMVLNPDYKGDIADEKRSEDIAAANTIKTATKKIAAAKKTTKK